MSVVDPEWYFFLDPDPAFQVSRIRIPGITLELGHGQECQNVYILGLQQDLKAVSAYLRLEPLYSGSSSGKVKKKNCGYDRIWVHITG
jgi:hypothetical protein